MHTKQERSSETHLCLSNFGFADSTADSLQPILETFKNILTGTNDSSTSGFGKDMRALVISFSFFIPIFFASRSESANNGDLTPTPPSPPTPPNLNRHTHTRTHPKQTRRNVEGMGKQAVRSFPRALFCFRQQTASPPTEHRQV